MFRQLTDAAVKAGAVEAKAGFDLIREFLLDHQRAWFGETARKHRRSLDWTTSWGGLAVALAFIGGSGAVIASFRPEQAWIAMGGILAAALSAYALNREALRRDQVNADRYEKARTALDELAARADTVADEIAAGRPEALTAYTQAITEQLENEHRQWLDGTAQVQALLAKFDEQLQQMKSKAPPEKKAAAAKE